LFGQYVGLRGDRTSLVQNSPEDRMTTQVATAGGAPGNRWKSVGAVLLGFAVITLLSLGTDQVFHSLGVFPPWGEPMHDHGLFLLALGYRVVYQVLGGYLAARFAPRNAMRHVWVLGGIGFVLSVLGAVASIMGKLGPNWYPIVLALTALPSVWLGGALYVRRSAASRREPQTH
jgi:hypothetical protein